MNKKYIFSLISLFLLTGCSFDDVMKSLEEYNNVEMIISLIIVIGLVIAILSRLFTKGSGDHEREYKKQVYEKMKKEVEQKNNNLNEKEETESKREDVFGNNNVPTTGNLEFEFYSDNGVVMDTSSNVVENIQSNVNNNVSSNSINNIPLVTNSQNNNSSGFNDLVNDSTNNGELSGESVDGPVIRINNQSVVVSMNENE